ncbi:MULTISPECIES: hypothetical protein [unclassified Leifsonia]|uniref:hypothetical protein n=1 Tax=unclassified Leifsonia TaxID=2663824 RepID=UPI000701B600|nr:MULTISPECIES: hypothetical protein [unclassified Leifsonia]KQX04967.1 hypothetical protein ASC59_12025 [Leifsonia sp. Root1293]KRA08599.1 hypothetical protein ASD61_12025 [Leifsonia sp. Root60]
MPDGPDEQAGADGEREPDPEIGGADWLLAQLSGGRRARRDADAHAEETDDVVEVDRDAETSNEDIADDEPIIPVWYGAPADDTASGPFADDSAPSDHFAPADDSASAAVAPSAEETTPLHPTGPVFSHAGDETDAAVASDAPVAPVASGASPDSGIETDRDPGATATKAATSSAVWHLFSDFDDEPVAVPPAAAAALPTPGVPGDELESDAESPGAEARTPAEDGATGDAAETGFHWGLRPGEDPAKYAVDPEPKPDGDDPDADDPDGDVPEDDVPPVIMAPFVTPVFGAPPPEPLRFPTPVAPPQPAPEAGSEGEQPTEAGSESHAATAAGSDSGAAGSADADADADADGNGNGDYADADTAATALLTTSAAERQATFIDTLDASPALSGLSLPPVYAASVADPDDNDDTHDDAADPITADPRNAASTGARGSDGGAPPTDGAPPTAKAPVDRRLLWIAGGLVLLVLLVGLYFLGTLLPKMFAGAPAPTPTASATPTPTPTPTPTVAPPVTGPAAAGEQPWDRLGGGECIDPYAGPWAETFTVVDCAAPHAAQLVYRGTFGGEATTAFPGEEALASQINLLCSAPGVIDLDAASGFPDLQLQGSFPVTEEQWTSTQRYYYCFVSRSSGEPITASVAGPGPAA